MSKKRKELNERLEREGSKHQKLENGEQVKTLVVGKRAIEELNNLAQNPRLDHTSSTVIESSFYKSIQGVTHLEASDIYSSTHSHTSALTKNAFLLLIKIVAPSPTLKSLNIQKSDLAQHGSLVAKTLVKSATYLEILNMSWNYLGISNKSAVEVAKALAQLPNLKILYMAHNNIINNKDATKITNELVKSDSLKELYFTKREFEKAVEPINKHNSEILQWGEQVIFSTDMPDDLIKLIGEYCSKSLIEVHLEPY